MYLIRYAYKGSASLQLDAHTHQQEQDEILGRTGPPHARRAYDYRQRGYDDDE